MEVMGTVSNLALNIGITLLSIVVIGGFIIAFVLYLRHQKRWSQYEVRIWGEDAFGQLEERRDRGGVFVNPKTKNKLFFIKKAKVGLNPDRIPVVLVRVKKDKVRRVVYLKQTGLKNFHFIKPVLNYKNVNLQVTEEDLNWAGDTYESMKKTFWTSTLMQYIPFIALGFVSIVILIIFIYLFKQFDTLKDVAEAMRQAATALSNQNVIQ